jgi:hypothetical protein
VVDGETRRHEGKVLAEDALQVLDRARLRRVAAV